MQRLAFIVLALGGCLSNPTVEVDVTSIDVPRGTSSDVLVSIDGEPVTDLDGVLWTVENPDLVTVTKSYDGYHLKVGGNYEGATVVHVNAYGQDVAIPTRIGPPALVMIWAEPPNVATTVGQLVEVRALGLDTLARVQDITFDSRWALRDELISQIGADLDQGSMMLKAMDKGQTTLHVTNGANTIVVPVAIVQ